MQFTTYYPSAPLRPFVFRYFIVEDPAPNGQVRVMPLVMPNGVCGLGFSYINPFHYRRIDGMVRQLSSANLIGMHDVPYTAQWDGTVGMLVVLFHPLGLSRVFGEDMSQMKNAIAPLADFGFRGVEEVCEQLSRLYSHREKIRYIEQWLGRHIGSGPAGPPPVLADVVDRIIRSRGQEPLHRIARAEGVHVRYIERYFSRFIGLSPKTFSEIIRFNHLVTEILFRNNLTLDEMTFLGGFADKSHLVRHFTKIARMTPSQFLAYLSEGPVAQVTNLHNAYLLFDGGASDDRH